MLGMIRREEAKKTGKKKNEEDERKGIVNVPIFYLAPYDIKRMFFFA